MCGSDRFIFMWVNVNPPISTRIATRCNRFSDFMKTNTAHRVLAHICKCFRNGMYLERRRESTCLRPGESEWYELSVKEPTWGVTVPSLSRTVSLIRHDRISRTNWHEPHRVLSLFIESQIRGESFFIELQIRDEGASERDVILTARVRSFVWGW